MKKSHLFIFEPGLWIGEGRISFTASPEKVHFYTKWVVQEQESLTIFCEQQVELRGIQNTIRNRYLFSEIKANAFKISLESESMGFLKGVGTIDERLIAWEFKSGEIPEGFEVYELQENGDYVLHAEYAKEEPYRTIIDGKIWKK